MEGNDSIFYHIWGVFFSSLKLLFIIIIWKSTFFIPIWIQFSIMITYYRKKIDLWKIGEWKKIETDQGKVKNWKENLFVVWRRGAGAHYWFLPRPCVAFVSYSGSQMLQPAGWRQSSKLPTEPYETGRDETGRPRPKASLNWSYKVSHINLSIDQSIDNFSFLFLYTILNTTNKKALTL